MEDGLARRQLLSTLDGVIFPGDRDVHPSIYGALLGVLAMPMAAVAQVLWLDWAAPAIRGHSGRAPATMVRTPI